MGRKKRFYDGLRPAIPLAEFLNTPPIHAQDLEKQLAEQIRKEQSAEIKDAFRGLVKKAVAHDNQKKMGALAIQAAELKFTREQTARQQDIANKYVAKKFAEEVIRNVIEKQEQQLSITATTQTLFGKPKGETSEQTSARLRTKTLTREIEVAKETGDTAKQEALTRELRNLKKFERSLQHAKESMPPAPPPTRTNSPNGWLKI